MNSNIIDVNESDFENRVLEESSNKLVVVDFWAPWCGPCKQLTPILEKVISVVPDKVIMAKINIDENQQIAAQLRIQSIPAVFAFKDKQVVNAFQGVIPEKDIVKFLETSLGGKLNNNFDNFYEEIDSLLRKKNFSIAKEKLESFISDNSKEVSAICSYAECLIEMEEEEMAFNFLSSLDEDLHKDEHVKKIIKRINLIKQKKTGPSIHELKDKLSKEPKNLEIIFKIADIYFAENNFNNSFDILLEHYPQNKERVKKKILVFFDVLGFKHESVIFYRKKLSSMLFS